LSADTNHGETRPLVVSSFATLAARARDLAVLGDRALLGICGPPGVGKSTLAGAVVDRVGETAGVVGMDGFHLSRARLAELGRLNRMGAINTFDARGFVALVQRLRSSADTTVYVPEFCRKSEISIAAAVAIEPKVELVVIEGNYLLVPDEPWCELRGLLNEIWYCERDDGARVADLIARHRAYGKSAAEAERWVRESDERNAQLIETTRSQADVIVDLDGELGHGMLARAERPTEGHA
jgi:pantothenate kinase